MDNLNIEVSEETIEIIVKGETINNTGEATAFVSIIGQPEDNTNLNAALNNKVNAGSLTEAGYASKSVVSTGDVNFKLSNYIKINLVDGNNSIEFTEFMDGMRCVLKLKQPSQGYGFVTWINSIRWGSGNSVPILTHGNNQIDLITILYDTDDGFLGNYSLNY